MTYVLPDPLPWTAIAGSLGRAQDALAQAGRRPGQSPIREGWIGRTHFVDAGASLWLQGALVHLEDLVLHDAGMDLRTPTHDLTRAHVVLRTRRRIAAAEPGWAMSRSGLAALSKRRVEEEDGADAVLRTPMGRDGAEQERGGDGASDDEAFTAGLAAIDALLER